MKHSPLTIFSMSKLQSGSRLRLSNAEEIASPYSQGYVTRRSTAWWRWASPAFVVCISLSCGGNLAWSCIHSWNLTTAGWNLISPGKSWRKSCSALLYRPVMPVASPLNDLRVGIGYTSCWICCFRSSQRSMLPARLFGLRRRWCDEDCIQ